MIQGQPASTGPLAINRPRHWVVEGDLLTLTTKDDADNPLSVGRGEGEEPVHAVQSTVKQ